MLKHFYKRLTPLSHLFQLKTWVALVKGLNLTFHNIELNTIMQNVLSFIGCLGTPAGEAWGAAKLSVSKEFFSCINENTSLGKVCRVISN